MPINETATACWSRLEGVKDPLMRRVERYASLTIPSIMLPNGFTPETTDQSHDFQSIGAQAVNHVTNKLMLSLFAPSRPFFKVQPDKATLEKLAVAGIDDIKLSPVLAKIEKDAVRELDARAQRPKLYTCVRQLVATGNVLLCLGPEELRAMSLRYFCVKRTATGKIHTLIIREKVKYDELEASVQAVTAGRYQPDSEVEHFKWISRKGNDLVMTQWVNQNQLPKEFNGKWPEEECPYRVLTWNLADECDYAAGLVEEYVGDFESMSALSEAVVDGAILGSEFRWLVNPTGITSADDLNKSVNGDALPGIPADIAPTQGGNPNATEQARGLLKDFEQRIARGFLLNSAMTRDAERVTAEEIRATAMELETSFGGVYSTLAAGIQLPIAKWLLKAIDASVNGTGLKVVVVTGLDALSRNGDLENLRLALNDLAAATALPPQLLGRIKWNPMVAFIGQGRGVELDKFVMSEEEFQQTLKAQQQQRVNEAAATSAGQAQGEASAQPGTA